MTNSSICEKREMTAHASTQGNEAFKVYIQKFFLLVNKCT